MKRQAIKKLENLLNNKNLLNSISFKPGYVSFDTYERAKIYYENLLIADNICPVNNYAGHLRGDSQAYILLDKEEALKNASSLLFDDNDPVEKKIEYYILDKIDALKEELEEDEYIDSIRATVKDSDYIIPEESEYYRAAITAAQEILEIEFPEWVYLAHELEALPLIANLANMYAKVISYDYYDHKDILLNFLAEAYPRAWSRGDGIIYLEHELAQVSFHVFSGQDETAMKYGLDPKGRTWSGIEVQFDAPELLREFIKRGEYTPCKFVKWDKLYERYEYIISSFE